MGLTGILRNNDNREIKKFLDDTVPDISKFKSARYKKAFDENRINISPVVYDMSSESALAGTAFDYLARFEVAKKLDSEQSKRISLQVLASKGLDEIWLQGYKKYYWKYKKLLNKSLYYIAKYITNEEIDFEEVIKACIYLAKFDQFYRHNFIKLTEFELTNQKMIDDLKNMDEAFKNWFVRIIVQKDSIVYFNPSFDCYRGADADIVIDDTLYDFKSGHYFGYQKVETEQIWAYYLMHEVDILDNSIYESANVEINNIALYRVRCCDCDYIKLKDIKKYKNLVFDFKNLLKKYKLFNGNETINMEELTHEVNGT